jgi:S-DNA-T family DNA segregation ATPase FtsK/SpoIIIE
MITKSSILAYIHRLDDDEERARVFKEMKVDNITDFLKKKIQKEGSMKKYLETVTSRFVSGATLNYKTMTIPEKIKMKLAEHGLGVEFQDMIKGNTVTLYRFEASIGLKMSKIEAYVKDIEQVVAVSGIRVLAPIKNTSLVGFEIPLETRTFPKNTRKSDNLIIGLDILGQEIELNVEEMPHLLVSGTTGSGKSVFLGEVVRQLQKKYKTLIFDPKGVDFKGGISDHLEIAKSLSGLVVEMKERYEEMKQKSVKKWSQTGKKSTLVIIDEYNDLFMSKQKIEIGKKEITKVFAKKTKKVEVPVYDTIGNVIDTNIKILAQKARSAGIHIILATQRPSIKVIDGDIKANFSTRISFRLPTITDSKVVLDCEGAEKLLGKGDGLLLKDGFITRFQSFSE